MALELAKLMAAVLLVQVVLLQLMMVSRVAQADCPDAEHLWAIQFDLPDAVMYKTWTGATKDDCCTEWVGVGCGRNNRVTSLSLVVTDYSGDVTNFPSSVFELTELDLLEIGYYLPNIKELPSRITLLSSLTYLSIFGTGIAGSIPPFLAQMNALESLSLSHNKFSGGVENLDKSNIKALDLDSNDLSGALPTVLPPKLQGLNLRNNNYTGSIDPATAQKWSNITYLDVSDNQITGTLEHLFNAAAGLQTLYVAGNQLNFNMTAMVLPPRLTALDVSRNQIFWFIPDQVDKLENLTRFVVKDNLLMGSIPSSLRNQPAANFANNFGLCGPPLPSKCVDGCFPPQMQQALDPTTSPPNSSLPLFSNSI